MPSKRFWPLDSLRGIALIGMILYHFFFDLAFLGIFSTYPDPNFARLIAATFLALVGFSFHLSCCRYRHLYHFLPHLLRRSLSIFLAATLVTLVTFIAAQDYTVRFGILHLISFALLLLAPLTLLTTPQLFLVFLAFLSIQPNINFAPSFDYYPLFPWFSLILAGYLIARHTPLAINSKQPTSAPIILLSWLGRHSLIVYLIHQPLLLLVLTLLFK